MATSKVDMSLDDIIKESRKGGNRGRGGLQRGRGGSRGRGGMRGRGSLRGRSNFGVRGGKVVKPGQRFSRSGGMRSFRRGIGFAARGASGFGRGRFTAAKTGGVSRLSISNLDFGVNDNDIKELFREFGVMTKATVNYDRSGRSLGTADVVYASPASAKAAAAHYNNVPLDGRPMRIQIFGGTTTGFKSTKPRGTFNRFQRTGGNLRGGFRRVTGQGFRGNRGGRGARGGRGGRGGRGRGGKPAPPSKEDLDKQLEQYNASA